MPRFGKRSTSHLLTCAPQLREICLEAIQVYDFSVLEGFRDEETQNRLHQEGKSKLLWPKSKHNTNPSRAIDITPYPIKWADTERFHFLAGLMFGVAAKKGIKLRWGGDWNRNFIFNDQSFYDLPHFELTD